MLYSLSDFCDTSLALSHVTYPAAVNHLDSWLRAIEKCRRFTWETQEHVYQSIAHTFAPADLVDQFHTLKWRKIYKMILKD